MKEKRVLIVDDEADVVDYLTAILQSHDYVVATAGNADEGYRLAGEKSPDLVCLDIMMPRESGLSLYVRLRQDKRLAHIPVIIISGMEKEKEFDFRDYVYNKKIPLPDKYLEKPINVDEFIRSVEQLVRTDKNPRAIRDKD